MLLVAALYLAHGVSVTSGGRGLPALALLALVLPGTLAAHLCARRGTLNACEKEGALSGLVTAHFAAALQVCVLVVAALTVDWKRYAEQAGPEIAAGVHDAAVPIAVILAAVTVALTYLGCILAGWAGALAYLAARNLRTAYCVLRGGERVEGSSIPSRDERDK
ncbi:MAG: hypothetical protein ACJ78Q_19860 [Chloroflexia bacterium]